MNLYRPLVLIVALCASAAALAQHHPESESYHQHIDARHGLNHPYADRGAVVHELPREALVVPHGSERYWFHNGVWYRPGAGGYVVIAPPFGVVVPVLPALYVTVMVGGVPYYYANDTYYSYNPAAAGYEVVAPPEGIESASALPPTQATPAPTAAAEQQYVYPRNGQTPEQQATDRYECHRWAVGQTGFDPTLTSGGVAPESADAKRAEYNRAMHACLEGRGYTVR